MENEIIKKIILKKLYDDVCSLDCGYSCRTKKYGDQGGQFCKAGWSKNRPICGGYETIVGENCPLYNTKYLEIAVKKERP